MANLRLQLLGYFQLFINDAPVVVPPARLQSLLAYFFLHRQTAPERQRLAFLFWPDSSEIQARGNLRKALYDLRRLIPDLDSYLRAGSGEQEEMTLYLDVTAFEDQVAQATAAKQPAAMQTAMEQAVQLYTGDFLPNCYDDWVLNERERLRQHYLYLLEQLVYLLEERRDYERAALFAQRLLQADPLRESTYRTLMRLHLQNGDRARALRIYHTCVTILQQELDVEPSAETKALYRNLLNLKGTPTPISTAHDKSSLVGRQQEWSALINEWRVALQGESRFVLIAGEAGIGKTRLAEELLHWAEQQGYTTARTRSYAAEGKLAYAPVAEWLRAADIRNYLSRLEPVWLSEVARLLPELLVERPDLLPPQALTDSWQMQRFREALARALTTVNQPLLLVIDDLQWCDRETLEWLHYLLRFVAGAQLLIVGTVRSEEIGPDHPLTAMLINLRQESKALDLEIGPLDATETATLAAFVAGYALEAGQAAALYAETEGHPLFVVETMRAGKSRVSTISSAPTTALPPKMQSIINSRLLQLTAATRDLVGLAAVVGRAFTVPILAHAGTIDDESLARGLDELWQRRIIREQGESAYDFSHDRIRDAAYSSVSPPRRRLLHRRVAEALEHLYATELDTVSGQIAAHYELAGLHEHAILFYRRAAEVAQRVYAHADAVSVLTIAIKQIDILPSKIERLRQKLWLQFALAVSLMTLKGMSSLEVRELYQQSYATALQVGDEAGQLVAMAGLHMTLVAGGELQAAYELSQHEIALAERVSDPSRLLEARGKLGIILLYQGHWRGSREYLEPIIAYTDYQWVTSSHPTPVMHWGLTNRRHMILIAWHLGYPNQALEVMYETLKLAKELAHPNTLAAVQSYCAWLYYFRRETARAQEWAESTILLSQQQSFPPWLADGLAIKGWTLAQQGKTESGISLMKEGLAMRLAMNAKLGHPRHLVMLAGSYGSTGDLKGGLNLLEKAIAYVEATGDRFDEAEVYRQKGDLLRIQEGGEQEAETNLLHSLAIAQQQEAKSLELRTAMSLARLWQKQDKCQQAYELLAPVYEWFTEGFDTLDLIEAKALLEAIS